MENTIKYLDFPPGCTMDCANCREDCSVLYEEEEEEYEGEDEVREEPDEIHIDIGGLTVVFKKKFDPELVGKEVDLREMLGDNYEEYANRVD